MTIAEESDRAVLFKIELFGGADMLSTLLRARLAAKFANKAGPIVLNRATGVMRSVPGVSILAVNDL